jgi:hypothetical protein
MNNMTDMSTTKINNDIIILKNDCGYASFVDEQINNTHRVVSCGKHNNEYFATVTNYEKSTTFKSNWFDWADGELEIRRINVGDVFMAVHRSYTSHKYSDVFKCYYYVLGITDENIELRKCSSVADAVKFQRKARFAANQS